VVRIMPALCDTAQDNVFIADPVLSHGDLRKAIRRHDGFFSNGMPSGFKPLISLPWPIRSF